jgi:hypothetical protein
MSEAEFQHNLNNYYEKVEHPTFGKTIIGIGTPAWGLSENYYSHAAVYIGTSKNGTQYIWTKNGFGNKPFIESVEANKVRWSGKTVLGIFNLKQ